MLARLVSQPDGQGTIPVAGHSMWPALREGDVAQFKALEQRPAPGEVLIARIGQRLIVHRVLRAEGGGVVLKGDACAREDALVPLSSVIGRVHAVSRSGRPVPAARWARAPHSLLVRVARRLRRAAWRTP